MIRLLYFPLVLCAMCACLCERGGVVVSKVCLALLLHIYIRQGG